MLALFLAARFGVTAKTIGFFYMYIGVIVRADARLHPRLGGRPVRRGAAVAHRVGAAGDRPGGAPVHAPHDRSGGVRRRAWADFFPRRRSRILPFLPLALAVALIPLGTAFTFPCVTALLSRVIPSNERGLYMGVQQTFGGAARVVFPALAGWAFDRFPAATLPRVGRSRGWHDSARAGYGRVHPSEARTRARPRGLVTRRSANVRFQEVACSLPAFAERFLRP